MKIEKPLNCSREVDNAANPENSSNVHKNKEHKMEVDIAGVGSSIEMNGMNGPKDDKGSECSLLKNEVDSRSLYFKSKVNSESTDGKVSTLEQPKTDSSSNSTSFLLPASSNDTNNANSSSMSSTCTDLGYNQKDIQLSYTESGIIRERKHLMEKLTGAPEANPCKKRSLEVSKEAGEREQSMLTGIDLNEDTTQSNEVEQRAAAHSVKNVSRPIPVFGRCTHEKIGFKGPGQGGWKGSASATSAFRPPTCHYKGSDSSEQKWSKGIDLNIDAVEEASPIQEKFGIDLNVSSESEENFQSSSTKRDFDLNDFPTSSDPDVQEGTEPNRAIHGHMTFLPRNAGGANPCYVGPMILPRMASMPFMLPAHEQPENATRAFPLGGSLNIPLYPAQLNGIPAFHGGGGPNLFEVRSGPFPHNMVRVGIPYKLYNGTSTQENAYSEGNGMQVLATPMFARQVNNFGQGVSYFSPPWRGGNRK